MAPEVGGAGPIDWGDDLGGGGGTNTWPDPANVLDTETWYENGVTTTGLLLSPPVAASGTAGSVDLVALKETIRYILDVANTTGGSPINLSENMVNPVQHVMKVNPEKLRPGGNFLNVVTVFVSDKRPEFKTIAKDQVLGRRVAKVTMKIAGIVWNDNMTDYREDPADNDLEYLMENIEVVLRHYATLNNFATWQIPRAITYHSSGYDEETHMRVGIMDLEITCYY